MQAPPKTVTIIATGVLTVSVSAPSKGYNGVAISMTASWNTGAVGPFLGQINWGDGSPVEAIARQSAKNITKTHTYTAIATRTITVNVSDEGTLASGSGTASIQIVTQLAASLSASPTSGAIPLAVTFTLGVSNGIAPYTYILSFGDGTSNATGGKSDPGTMSISHTYTKVGSFTATLTFTDALGATAVRLLDLFAGVVPQTLLDAVTFALASIPLLVVGGTIVANELQRARVWG